MKKLGTIVLGNLIYSSAVAFFILPNGLITGGTTGLALFTNYLFSVPIAAFIAVFNISMFILGLWILGKNFALTTLLSTFCYPFFLAIFQKIQLQIGLLTTDPLLATIFAGLLVGSGIGLVIRAGASTGGMDIPPLILQKKTGLSVSISLYLFDSMILILQMFFSNREQILYGILLVCIYTFFLEKLLVYGKRQMQVKIISSEYETINSAIQNKLDRGTTLLPAKGGYSNQNIYMIMTILSQRELFHLNELVLSIDPDAFLIVNQVNEVHGKGFTQSKEYHNPEDFL
ncbi:MAG: YitT family protein [Lachnospiraceae bacterium]|nr:YitT family protein [Lachnospiraceae bacterium]